MLQCKAGGLVLSPKIDPKLGRVWWNRRQEEVSWIFVLAEIYFLVERFAEKELLFYLEMLRVGKAGCLVLLIHLWSAGEKPSIAGFWAVLSSGTNVTSPFGFCFLNRLSLKVSSFLSKIRRYLKCYSGPVNFFDETPCFVDCSKLKYKEEVFSIDHFICLTTTKTCLSIRQLGDLFEFQIVDFIMQNNVTFKNETLFYD